MSIDYTLTALVSRARFAEGLESLKKYESVNLDSIEWGGEGRWIQSTKIQSVIDTIDSYFGTPEFRMHGNDGLTKLALQILGTETTLTFSRYSHLLSSSAKISNSIIVNITLNYRELPLIGESSDDFSAFLEILDAFAPIYARVEGDWSSFPLTEEDRSMGRQVNNPFWKRDYGYTRFLGVKIFKRISSHCAAFDINDDGLHVQETSGGGAIVLVKTDVIEGENHVSERSIELLSSLSACLDALSDQDYMNLGDEYK
jgi:hypothetical protein